MVVGITMVRDEQDIIASTIARMASQVDAIIVADNLSADGTRQILDELASSNPNLMVVYDPEVGYYQATKMSRLAAMAWDHFEADVVVAFDADEVWYSPFGRLADVVMEHPSASIFTAALYDHVATGLDPDEPDPVSRMGWRRRDPAPLPKVAARPRPEVRIHQGNHGADHGDVLGGLLVVLHFPYRSPEQFVTKVRNGAAAYAATDLPETAGAHWRQYGAILDASGPEVLVDEVYRRWFWEADPEAAGLFYDPAPSLS